MITARPKDVIVKAYQLLHSVLATAVEGGSIRANPAISEGAGQHDAEARRMPTLERVFALACTASCDQGQSGHVSERQLITAGRVNVLEVEMGLFVSKSSPEAVSQAAAVRGPA
jgi:hypothetical protein